MASSAPPVRPVGLRVRPTVVVLLVLALLGAALVATLWWALRSDGYGTNDGCEANGQHVPFKTTRAERIAAGDPRLSLEERYTNHEGYVAAVARAAEKLEKQRLLLPADVQQYVERARASSVLR